MPALASAATIGHYEFMALVDLSKRKNAVAIGLLILLAFATNWLFQQVLHLPSASYGYFWPMLGLGMGLALCLPYRYWLWLIPVLLVLDRQQFLPAYRGFEHPVAATLEYLSYYLVAFGGAYLLRRRYPDGLNLSRLNPDLRDFLIFSGLLTLTTGFMPTLYEAIGNNQPLDLHIWNHWITLDLMSMLVVAPLLLAWTSESSQSRNLRKPSALAELTLLFATLVAVLAFEFYGPPMVTRANFDLVWLPVLWAMFRFDLRVMTIVFLVSTVYITVNLSNSLYPITHVSEGWSEQSIVTTAYIAGAVLVALVLNALIVRAREQQRDRERLQDIIHESDKLNTVGALAAGLAHDWNNVLLVLTMEIDRLRDRQQQEAWLRECVDVLAQVVAEGRNLTEQLMSLARRDQEAAIDFDLPAEIKTAADLLARALPDNIVLRCSDQSNDTCNVHGQLSHVHQILMNLGLNARDAIGDARGSIHVTVAGPVEAEIDEVTRRVAVLTVADDGCGMTPETIERVFEPLYTTRRDSGGTGLGMAIVRSFVTAMQGAIEIASSPGDGTTVVVQLPVTSKAKYR